MLSLLLLTICVTIQKPVSADISHSQGLNTEWVILVEAPVDTIAERDMTTGMTMKTIMETRLSVLLSVHLVYSNTMVNSTAVKP